VGAHPDDCEISCGGTAALLRRQGHEVTFLSVTDGGAGHHALAGERLLERRAEEARRAAEVIGASSVILPFADGHLTADLPARLALIRAVRAVNPHIVITNRPNDYHPDHRAAAQLVQDAAYSLLVPNIAPEAPAMRFNPVVLHWWDRFTRPVVFGPSLVVAVDAVREEKLEMICRHESQVYEWLPWVRGELGSVPASEGERREWLRARLAARVEPSIADRYRERLRARYGRQSGDAVVEAEAFELSEYGTQLDDDELSSLFGARA